VPLIANWPRTIEKGVVSDALIDFTDILPTVLDAANIEIPANFQTDGISFLPQLKGSDPATKREWVYCYYDPNWGKFPKREWVQNGKWKYYQNGEFYDVESDPHETDVIEESEFTPEMRMVVTNFKEVLQKMQ
jgi:arylsulfatase A-like enzyme